MDEHIGIAISGLTSDARALCQLIFNAALSSRQDMDRSIPIRRLISMLSEKGQYNTQHYGGRPFGVGLLIAGFDETGPHLYEFQPSGCFFEYWAYSIGARSQSARTYFERSLEELPTADLDSLILHALTALNECLPPDQKLEVTNCSLGYLSKDEPFTVVSAEELAGHLTKLPPKTSTVTSTEVEMQPATTPKEETI